MLKAKLVVVGGDAKSKEVTLRLPTVIGRGKDVSLTLPHALVSRRHAEVFERDGQLYVRDLGSLNGTYVNNRRISGDQPLPPLTLLTLGNVTFRAVYETESRVVGSTSAPNQVTQRNDDETVDLDELRAADSALGMQPDAGKEPSPAVPPQPDLREQMDTEPAPPLAGASPDEPEIQPAVEQPVAEQPAYTESAIDVLPGTPDQSVDLKSDSSILVDAKAFARPDESISVSGIESLPSRKSVSAIGFDPAVISGDTPDHSMVEHVDFHFGDGAVADAIDGDEDQDFGSFLKKLPK